MADFEQDCDEILEDYSEVGDPIVDCNKRNRLWKLLQTWQLDKEYLSSLNLHRVIAKHVRISGRAVQSDGSLEGWVKKDCALLDRLADEIARAIRAAWQVRAPAKPNTTLKFSEELSFDSIDNFHRGLEELIGYPPTNLDFLESMKQEHEQGKQFVDREGRDVDPKVEWNIVMWGTEWNIPGASCKPTTTIKNRDCAQQLDFYIQRAKDKFAIARALGTLIEAEVAALRLWTGPMHREYAQALRNPQKQNGPYVTTLHAINSGITKLARIWPLPASRKVYRGYKNLRLEDLRKDAFNCVGGVEKCVLATSEDFNVAVDYSVNASRVGAFILEIDVGQVNRGADVSWLSQFPHEREILFNALSNVEFVCSPQQRFVEGRGTILVYQVCVSANVKGKTLEEFVRLRRDLHLNLYQEAQLMISKHEDCSRYNLIKDLGAECRKHCEKMRREAEAAEVGIFNKRTQAYVSLEEAVSKLPSMSFDVMDLVLRWFETHRADPAEIDRLQDWQIQALRTVFKSNERPQVTTIVMEKRYHVDSFFGARSLKFDNLYTLCRVAKLLSLNPVLESLEMEELSGTAELWEKIGTEFGQFRPSLRVNRFHLSKYAMRTLQQLELGTLGYEMATMICPALMIHTPNALISLCLYSNPIGCAGAECLGRTFTGLQRLRYVDLRKCQIASRGCTAISQNLSALTELEILNLAYNKATSDGFNVLADAVRTLQLETLRSVDMRCNRTWLPSLHCGPRCVIKNSIISSFWTNGAVTCVSWSPRGDQIVFGSYGAGSARPPENNPGDFIILDVKSGQKVSMPRGHTKAVTSVAWHPAGEQIASGSLDNTTIIWNAKTGEQVLTLKGHKEPVTSVAWRPVGDQIASGSQDGTIMILDTKTGEQVSTLNGHNSYVTSVVWRPGGDHIASASWDKTIILWDAKTGDQVLKLIGHTDVVTSLAWRPAGDQIASGSGDETIIIWDSETGKQVMRLKGHTSYVTSVAWCPGGELLAGGCGDPYRGRCENEIIIWYAGKKVITLRGHSACVMSVVWSPRGDQIASGSRDKTIIIWDANTGDRICTPSAYTKAVTSVAWRPWGDQIASACRDGTIIISNTHTGNTVSMLKGHTSAVMSVAWRPGGDQIASASNDNTVIIWDAGHAKTCNKVLTLKGHTKAVKCVAWCPEGSQIASGSADNTIIIWDEKTGQQISTLHGHTDWVRSVAWSPGGDQLASGSYDETIIIWNAKTGDQVLRVRGHTDTVTSVAWHPVGDQIASGSTDNSIIIWDAKTGKQVSTLKGHTDWVTSVSWHSGGDYIASASDDKTIIIWEAETGHQISILNRHKDVVTSVAWRPGGDQLVSGGYGSGGRETPGEVRFWDAITGNKISERKGHSDAVTNVLWNCEGDQITLGSSDKTIITCEQGVRPEGHTGAVASVA